MPVGAPLRPPSGPSDPKNKSTSGLARWRGESPSSPASAPLAGLAPRLAPAEGCPREGAVPARGSCPGRGAFDLCRSPAVLGLPASKGRCAQGVSSLRAPPPLPAHTLVSGLCPETYRFLFRTSTFTSVFILSKWDWGDSFFS